jgi:hypothetical protein
MSRRVVSLNGGVYWVKETPDELVEKLTMVMEDQGINIAASDILINEILPLLKQGEKDTKTLEIIAKNSGDLGDNDSGCPPGHLRDCFLYPENERGKQTLEEYCTKCWMTYMRERMKDHLAREKSSKK